MRWRKNRVRKLCVTKIDRQNISSDNKEKNGKGLLALMFAKLLKNYLNTNGQVMNLNHRNLISLWILLILHSRRTIQNHQNQRNVNLNINIQLFQTAGIPSLLLLTGTKGETWIAFCTFKRRTKLLWGINQFQSSARLRHWKSRAVTGWWDTVVTYVYIMTERNSIVLILLRQETVLWWKNNTLSETVTCKIISVLKVILKGSRPQI